MMARFSYARTGWRTVRLLPALILLMTVAARAGMAASDLPEVKIAYVEFYPIAFTNGQGQPDGVLVKLAERMLDQAGIRWSANAFPAARMIENLKTGDSSLAIMVKNPSSEECCLTGDKPLFTYHLDVYSIGDKPAIASRDALIGKRLIVLSGYTYSGLAGFFADEANHITAMPARTHEQGFEMLEAGRGDYLIDYDWPANSVLALHPVAGLHRQTLSELGAYLHVSRKYPAAEDLFRILSASPVSLDK